MYSKLKVNYIIIILLFLLKNFASFGQNSENDVSFVTETILKNYLPLRPIEDSIKIVKLTHKYFRKEVIDTFLYLAEYFLQLNDGHLTFASKKNEFNYDTNLCKSNYINAITYLNATKLNKTSYEGFWASKLDGCVIAIVKNQKLKFSYTGYLIEGDSGVLKGSVICSLYKKTNNGILTKFSPPYKGSRSVVLLSTFLSKNRLKTGTYEIWERLEDYKPETPRYKNSEYESFEPSFSRINTGTCVFKLPSLSPFYTGAIDSILNANDSVIRNSKHFIIDIRNNAGGEGRTYLPLLKYVYTNPILRQSSVCYYSNAYISYLQENMNSLLKKGDSNRIKQSEAGFKEVISKRNSYTYKVPPIFVSDSVFKHPENVAVLINGICVSAGELFVLALSQSRKVTIFGENSGGVIDYLSTFSLTTPSKKYTITIPFERRTGTVKEFKRYEHVGIRPDVFIRETEDDWVQFVIKYYDQRDQ